MLLQYAKASGFIIPFNSMFYKCASLGERFNIIVNLYEIYYYIKKQLHSSCFNPSQTGIEPATFRLGGEPSILLRY